MSSAVARLTYRARIEEQRTPFGDKHGIMSVPHQHEIGPSYSASFQRGSVRIGIDVLIRIAWRAMAQLQRNPAEVNACPVGQANQPIDIL
jgi:hypothetical protein